MFKDEYPPIGQDCSKSDDADQMVDRIVETDSLVKGATC
jgi:hypothetical protein